MTLTLLGYSLSAASINAVTQRFSQLLLDLKLNERAALYILLALAVGFAIGRLRASSRGPARVASFQNRAEALLSRVMLANFGPPDYHLMNHVTLRMTDGTTQVDHILVSRFGVFVIEAKDYGGWIYANAYQENWTQVFFKARFKFQNPILQNYRHVLAVQGLLDFLPPGAIKPVVVFTGEAKFMTEMPPGVFGITGFVDHLRTQTVEVMSLNRLQFAVGRLETARLAISKETDVEHVRSLALRHGRTA